MLGAAVPEATIDEDGDARTPEPDVSDGGDVRLRTLLQAKGEPSAMQR
jgi:hypothetical protein